MTDLARLYELQKIDLTSLKVRRRLSQLKALLTESEELQTARTEKDKAAHTHEQWHNKQKAAELEMQSLAQRIEEGEQRLMSGQVRNPKELESLQASIEALQRQRGVLETESVEALLKVDEWATQLAAAEQHFDAVQTDWNTHQAKLQEEDTKLRRAYVHLKKQREAVASVLDSALLDEYEQMRQRKAGVAITTVENSSCRACHVTVPSGVLSTLRSQAEKLIYCPSCGRMLYAT